MKQQATKAPTRQDLQKVMPPPQIVQWAKKTLGATTQEAVQAYQNAAHMLAQQGVDIKTIPVQQLAQIAQQVLQHPAMQAISKNPKLAQAYAKGSAAKQAQRQPGPPGGNPEVVSNPPGNAPVQVQPLAQAGQVPQKKLATGGTVEPGESAMVGDTPDQSAPSDDQLQQVTVTAASPTAQPPTNPSPPTTASAIPPQAGKSPNSGPVSDMMNFQQLLAQYGPDKVRDAFAAYKAANDAQATNKAMATLFSTMNGPEAANANETHWQNVQNQNKLNTIGQLEAQQTSATAGVNAASGLQKVQQGDIQTGIDRNKLTLDNIDTNYRAQLADPNSQESQQLVSALNNNPMLKQYGISVPQGISGVEAQGLLTGIGGANKIVNDTIDAQAKAVQASAAATQAGTEASKLAFEKSIVGNGNGQYTWSGGGPQLKPGQVTSQEDFAKRVSASTQAAPALDQSLAKYGDAFSQALNDNNVSWGKLNPNNFADLQTKHGNTYQLESKFNALASDGLAAAAQQIGGVGELRSAQIDSKLINGTAPTTSEDRTAALNKIVQRASQNIRTQELASQLQQFQKSNPGSDGSDFKPDFNGKVAVWNPKTNEHGLIPQSDYAAAYKNGFRDVDHGLNGFNRKPPGVQQ